MILIMTMTAILFQDINKTFQTGFKKYPVLHDISFQVNKGEIFGFLGPNGAGKSTCIKILLNFIQPGSGQIFIDDIQVGKNNFQHLIGYLPETPCFYENLTGLETLVFAGRTSGMKKDLIHDAAQNVLKRLDLDTAGDKLIKAYSKGMKQRLGIAMALIHDPDIFILDEPMSGLDPMGRKLVTDVILELKQRGKTVFFSSHILSDIEKLCDRIGILNRGKLLYTGSTNNITDHNDNDVEKAFIKLIELDEN
ncbi:MAG: ABC transporter ATP-binding protein [Pseudomonadota bacterium]